MREQLFEPRLRLEEYERLGARGYLHDVENRDATEGSATIREVCMKAETHMVSWNLRCHIICDSFGAFSLDSLGALKDMTAPDDIDCT